MVVLIFSTTTQRLKGSFWYPLTRILGSASPTIWQRHAMVIFSCFSNMNLGGQHRSIHDISHENILRKKKGGRLKEAPFWPCHSAGFSVAAAAAAPIFFYSPEEVG